MDGISTVVLNVKNDKKENVHLVRFAALILLLRLFEAWIYADMITFKQNIRGYIKTCTNYCFDFFCFTWNRCYYTYLLLFLSRNMDPISWIRRKCGWISFTRRTFVVFVIVISRTRRENIGQLNIDHTWYMYIIQDTFADGEQNILVLKRNKTRSFKNINYTTKNTW